MVGLSDIHIEPRLIAEGLETPVMKDLQAATKKRFRLGGNEERSFAERLLSHSIERFGGEYLNEMAGHIEHAFRLRDQAAAVIDEVLGPEALSAEGAAAKLERLFQEIKGDIDAITDPVAYTKQRPIPVPGAEEILLDLTPEGQAAERNPSSPETSEKPSPQGPHVERTELLSKAFKAMSQRSRKAMRKAADVAPRELWRAVSSETEGGLERNIASLIARGRAEGMSSSELKALETAARSMSKERARSQSAPGLRIELSDAQADRLRRAEEADKWTDLPGRDRTSLGKRYGYILGELAREIAAGGRAKEVLHWPNVDEALINRLKAGGGRVVITEGRLAGGKMRFDFAEFDFDAKTIELIDLTPSPETGHALATRDYVKFLRDLTGFEVQGSELYYVDEDGNLLDDLVIVKVQ